LIAGQGETDPTRCLRPQPVALDVVDAEKVVAGSDVSGVVTATGYLSLPAIYVISRIGDTTLCIMTLSIMTFSIMTLSIMTFSIMTLSIMTLSIMTA
jgi:hypothetical protein